MSVDDAGAMFNFCPGKATWSPAAARLFEQCRIALETGILPKGTTFEEQDVYFAEALPVFIERWRARIRRQIWDDVSEFLAIILTGLFGKK